MRLLKFLSLAAALGGSAAAFSQGPVAPLDSFGGISSERVILRVKPAVQQNIDGFGRPGLAQLEMLGMRWRVQATKPYSQQGYGDRALADKLGLTRTYILIVPKGTNTPQMISEYNRTPGVEFAEADGIGGVALTPNDPLIGNCYGMNNTGQNGGVPDADIDAFEAWDLYTGGDQITIAVIDSGVDHTITELKNKYVPGWNTYNNTGDTMDRLPHGTHVTGTATAEGNNNFGVAGVSWNGRFMPVKVLSDGGSGSESQCGAGMIYAADNGAKIGTMSLQYYTGSSAFNDAVNYAWGKGVLLIAATGNNQGRRVAYPAKFQNCFGIGATTNTDSIASFSNYGPEVDVAAPGENVYSTLPGNSYAYYSGTSMATPHTSGTAMLLWSYDITLTNAEVFELIRSTAEDKGAAGFDERFGWGRINASFAMQKAALNRFVADSFAVTKGTQTGGDANSLKLSDNNKLTIQAALPIVAADPYARLELTGTAPQGNVVSLRFVSESSANVGGIGQTIEFYNYQSQSWESIGSGTIGNGVDGAKVVRVDSNPSRFIDSGTRQMRARVSFSPLVSLSPNFSLAIDEARWSVFTQ